MSEMVEMPEGARWDGYPVFGRDRDAWHLLNFDEAEHPVPMWWDWRSESWFSDPDSNIALKAADAEAAGYWYLAGTVTPSDLNDAIAEAVAAERGKGVAAQKPAAWVDAEDLPSEECQRRAAHLILKRTAIYNTPLYIHPANVAALEARIAELEGKKGRKQEEARRYRNALINICDKTSEFSISHKTAHAALKREGGV